MKKYLISSLILLILIFIKPINTNASYNTNKIEVKQVNATKTSITLKSKIPNEFYMYENNISFDDDITLYDIRYSENSNMSNYKQKSKQDNSYDEDVKIIKGLKPGTTYYVQIYLKWLNLSTTPIKACTIPDVKDMGNIKISNITSSSVTFSWDKAKGALSYTIENLPNHLTRFSGKEHITTKTSITINKLLPGQTYNFLIYPNGLFEHNFYKNNFEAKITIKSPTPKLNEISSINNNIYNSNKKRISPSIGFNYKSKNQLITLSQIAYFTNNNKKIKTYNQNAMSNKKIDIKYNKVYKIKVRSYILTDDGKKVYSDWTDYIKFAYPKNNVKKINNNKYKITWSKISGANKYVIYIGNSETNMRKYKTLSSSKTAITINKRFKYYRIDVHFDNKNILKIVETNWKL